MPLKIIRRKDTGALTIAGTVKLPDGSRQRIRARAQSDDMRLAREEAAALEARLLRDAWHGKRRGTRSLGEAVIAYLESEPRSVGTKRRLHRLLRAVGDVPLGAVSQETVIRARQTMEIATPATIRRGIITPLRAVMLHANRLGWCDAPHFELAGVAWTFQRHARKHKSARHLAEAKQRAPIWVLEGCALRRPALRPGLVRMRSSQAPG